MKESENDAKKRERDDYYADSIQRHKRWRNRFKAWIHADSCGFKRGPHNHRPSEIELIATKPARYTMMKPEIV